jgi:hypothetical protein
MYRPRNRTCKKGDHGLTSTFALGDAFIGSYFPSPRIRVPEDEPSTNSIAGGRRLLNASMSFAGRYCGDSSEDLRGEKDVVGYNGEASISSRLAGRGSKINGILCR